MLRLGQHRRKVWHDFFQAAELRNLPRFAPVIEHPDNEQQHGGGNSVIDILNQGAHHADSRKRENAKHDEPNMRDRRIRNQSGTSPSAPPRLSSRTQFRLLKA